MVIPVPLTLIIQRNDKKISSLQTLQQPFAFVLVVFSYDLLQAEVERDIDPPRILYHPRTKKLTFEKPAGVVKIVYASMFSPGEPVMRVRDRWMDSFEEEYAGVPGMICFSLGIIIIIVIVVAVMMITRKGKRAKRMEEDGLSFQSFEPETSFQTFDDSPMTFSLPGDEPVMSFAPIGEEPDMSFTTFEEAPPSLDAAQPAVVQCPDCGEYLRVRAAHRPFEFPCKCGAKLVLK